MKSWYKNISKNQKKLVFIICSLMFFLIGISFGSLSFFLVFSVLFLVFIYLKINRDLCIK
ncbi:hypothetical protein [uncultured Gammaproteobacteria bacterium]|nr:hypothetical protein [uncultured Gammaproteobacteria bacterium]